MSETIRLRVNRAERSVEADPEAPLLAALRGLLGLSGTPFGCGEDQCGACNVMIDGQAVASCATPLWAAALLRRNPDPSEMQVRAALDRNLCRCGAHNRMVRAVLRAAKEARA
jgi:nicotinate dehydrogenase subunit A